MTNIMIKYNYFLKLDYFKSSVVYVLKRTTFLKLFVNLFLSKKNKRSIYFVIFLWGKKSEMKWKRYFKNAITSVGDG